MKIELDHQELETVVKTVLEHIREDRNGFTKDLIRTVGPTFSVELTKFIKRWQDSLGRPKIVADAPAATGTDG